MSLGLVRILRNTTLHPLVSDVPSIKNFSSKEKKKSFSVLCDKFLLLLDYEADKVILWTIISQRLGIWNLKVQFKEDQRICLILNLANMLELLNT